MIKELHIVDELKRLSRRIDEQGKTLDMLFADREILEDLLTRMTAIEGAMNLQRSTQTETAKNIRTNINDARDEVVAKVDQVAETMDNKTVVVKSDHDNIIQKVVSKLQGK